MYEFKDYYQNTVQLSFEHQPFSDSPKHVWVICRYGDKWLLTEHEDRGFEFPGGKVEPMECAEEAALREVKEETGAAVRHLKYVGQYKVLGREKVIVKNIYFADIEKLEKQANYFETKGPVLFSELPENLPRNKKFSFIMKDSVLPISMKKLKEDGVFQS
ncbi:MULTISPECIES: RNA deprotection pyrophosphohydrolase [Bacillus]|uniref:RNA deprotection pyrophosphohydrolase n=1 Tax=Bacillus TaxID=1386 RepID=UPI000D21DF2F|nr:MULTISPECIES: nucleoside triphosphatase YtkD [Bacillus]AVX16316.1 nucleoside triphosphatase YtkD [Bacillus sp. ZY-1-1]AWM84138.1 nucleoside triphosphatase YtkD [Bacillus velezensis]MDF3254348.1 nucleoside triphosphatase YtkD [Bacillus velezensis]MDF3268422.1 nucleoside triphosphatase YtkD [Bacillus velezensis]